MNKVIIAGNACADAEVRRNGEKAVATIRVAATTSRKDSEGKFVTGFYTVTAFGKQAEFAEKYVKKGRNLEIVASFRNDNYTDKDGNKVYSYQLYADSVSFGIGASFVDVCFSGNLTKDVELRYSSGEKQTAIGRFSVACNRGKDSAGNELVDFLDIVCFGKQAENVEKYRSKGDSVAVRGELINEKYTDREGKDRYSVHLYAERIDFGRKKGDSSGSNDTVSSDSNGFMNIPDGIIDELPFT